MSNEKILEQEEEQTKEESKTIGKEKEIEKEESQVRKPPMKITKELLVKRLRQEVSSDDKFWRMVYMLSDDEFLRNSKEDFEKGEIYINGICAQMKNCDHEDVYRCLAENMVKTHYRNNPNYSFYYRRLFGCDMSDISFLKHRCGICSDNMPACPYRANGLILYTCMGNNIDPEEVYKDLQGRLYKKKESLKYPQKCVSLSRQDYEFLDLFTVFAAVIMLKERWLTFTKGLTHCEYEYADILKHLKTTNIPEILKIYDGQGEKVKINPGDFKEHVCEKVLHPNVFYNQYPQRVAAYIAYLAHKNHTSAVEVGLYIMKQLCDRKNGVHDTYCVELYRYRLSHLPFDAESRKLAEKMFDYIINHYYRNSIPYMPLNMVVYSDDDQETDDLIGVFRWVCGFYNYFGQKNNDTYLEEVSLANTPISELADYIEEISLDAAQPSLKGPRFIHVKDFHLLPEIEKRAGENILDITKLQNIMEEQQDKVCLIISGERDKLERVLKGYNEFYNMTVDRHLTMGDMSVPQMVAEIMSRLEINYQFEEGFENAMKGYVFLAHQESKLKSKSFIDKVVRDVSFNHYDKETKDELLRVRDIPTINGARSEKDIWEDINALEGLENVKEEMRKLQNLLTFRRKTMGKGIAIAERPNMHMVFAGNPGTGKTTVARLLGNLLFNFGYLKENKIIEASPRDLIAQWVGQTAPKTAQVCQSAYGGLLFIDEAYELASSGAGNANDAFRSECVTELIKQMEDHRDKLIIVFAGYTKEMKNLMETNAGLSSRVGTFLQFEDFSKEELLHIYETLVEKAGMELTQSAREVVKERIEDAITQKDFGNGRYIRNLYEKTITLHATNTIESEDVEVLLRIEARDIPDVDSSRQASRKSKIGFI